jgi:hypothetical protein
LRALCAVLRWFPCIAGAAKAVARRDPVAAVFERQTDFSNIAHAANLVAGPFMIGMEIGPEHTADREFLEARMPPRPAPAVPPPPWTPPIPSNPPSAIAIASEHESKARIAGFLQTNTKRFDLVNDYMVWVVWSALGAALDTKAAAAIVQPGNDCDARSFFLQVRYVGANLIIGDSAPQRVRQRAHAAAVGLQDRVNNALHEIKTAWPHASIAAVRRNAIGMLWVGHPATVQAGALIIQELFNRRRVYRKLAAQAQSLDGGVWTNVAFRTILLAHIFELLRFRPVFPVLPRTVMRDTLFEPKTGVPLPINGGSTMKVFTIGALFDRDAVEHPGCYVPDLGSSSRFKKDADDRYLLFGMGPRSCIARFVLPEILLNAITGLMLLPDLNWANCYFNRMQYDGPIVTGMKLRFR